MLRGVGVESVKLPPRSPNLSLQVWTPAGKRQALHIRCWQSVPERGAELLISIVQNSLSSQEGPTTWRAFTVYAFVRTDLRVALAYLTSPAPPVSVAGPVAPGRTYQCQC
jgi:hypothetical protein